MDLNLYQKVALVTGAGQGMGRAIAQKLASEGARIAINDINFEKAKKTQESISQARVESEIYIADVTDYSAIQCMVAKIIKRFGHLHILVNNAGIALPGDINQTTPEKWQKVIDVNLTGVFNCTAAVFPHMSEKNYGKIVSIASYAAKRGAMAGGGPSYGASKAGVMGFTVSLAMHAAQNGITINTVAPGYIDTEMLRTPRTEEQLLQLAQLPMIKRLGKPDDVANLVAFLTSDVSDYITGETIDINGGMYLDL